MASGDSSLKQLSATPRSIPNRVINSLAILKANWDELGHDYIQNFVPFTAEILRTAPQDEVSLPEIQKGIKERFGLGIPQGALKTILHRCAKQGLIKQQNRIYLRNRAVLDKLVFTIDQAAALREHRALIDKLIAFCSERYETEWTTDEADSALLEYLEERSPTILAAAIDGNPISPPPTAVKNADFLIKAFVHHLWANDPEGFSFLETIVKGSMLANVLIFPEIAKVQRLFESVEIYFDTPFILGAIGLEGESRQASSLELLSLLYKQKAKLAIFQHTRDEVSGVLDAAARSLRSGRKPAQMEFFEYLGGKEYKPSDIELVIAKLDESLGSLRIKTKPRPSQTVALGLDEARLDQIMESIVSYRSERAKHFDIDSLTAIHRLRGGKPYQDIESCQAVFITQNTNLIKAAREYFNTEYERTTVPLAIRDDVLTTIVWLKQPMSAVDLPRTMIIADCFAAMKPPDRLWKIYLAEIEKLSTRGSISENDYYLLRYSVEARRALMDFTLGSPEGFTEGTVAEVLKFAQNAIKAESAEALAVADLALKGERARRLRAELEKEKALAVARQMYAAQFERAREIGVAVGAIVGKALLWTLVVLLFFATYFTLPRPFPQPEASLGRYVVPALLFMLGVLSGFHLCYGTTARDFAHRWELSVAEAVEKVMLLIIKPKQQ